MDTMQNAANIDVFKQLILIAWEIDNQLMNICRKKNLCFGEKIEVNLK